MSLVDLDNVSKTFRSKGLARPATSAVRGVSLTMPRGGVFGLVGESGSGKTTLARALLFLDPPTEGRVRFDGVDLGGLRRSEIRAMRRRMQIVFQDPTGALNPRLRVRKSLEEGLHNLGLGGAEVVERIDEVSDLVSIPATHLVRYPHEFSGGQIQRLVIARALTMRPEFLVLDEPVSSLDVSIQARIVNLLIDVKQKLSLTYLFISHDLNLVAYLCDRIAVMRAGRLVEVGNADDLIEAPSHIYTRRLFADTLQVRGWRTQKTGEATRGTNRESGCAFDRACSMKSKCIRFDPPFTWRSKDHGVACFKAT